MRTLDEMLARELNELAASPDTDKLLGSVLRAAAILARDGEQRALTHIGAVLGAAAVVFQRREDPSFGLLFRASRAILNRAAVGMKQSLVRFTIDELLLSLGAERAEHRAARISLDELEGHVLNLRGDRTRLEGDNARLRTQLLRLEDVEHERDAAIVERDVARARLRDAGHHARVSESTPTSAS